MPALPPVPKVIRVDLFSTDGGNTRVKDRFFMQYTGVGGSLPDLATWVNTIVGAIGANFTALQQNQYTWTAVQATDLTSPTSPQVIQQFTATGASGVTPAGAGAALVLKFKISRRYRGGHPRLYMSGLRNTDYGVPPTWQSASVNAWVTAWNNFQTAIKAAPPASLTGLIQVNVSYFQSFTVFAPAGKRARNIPTPRPVPLVDSVISVTGNPNVASQRRRNLQSA